jgi:hypothetical protein
MENRHVGADHSSPLTWNETPPAVRTPEHSQAQDVLEVSLLDEELLEELRVTTELMLAAGASGAHLSTDAIDAVLFFLDLPHQRSDRRRGLHGTEPLPESSRHRQRLTLVVDESPEAP